MNVVLSTAFRRTGRTLKLVDLENKRLHDTRATLNSVGRACTCDGAFTTVSLVSLSNSQTTLNSMLTSKLFSFKVNAENPCNKKSQQFLMSTSFFIAGIVSSWEGFSDVFEKSQVEAEIPVQVSRILAQVQQPLPLPHPGVQPDKSKVSF